LCTKVRVLSVFITVLTCSRSRDFVHRRIYAQDYGSLWSGIGSTVRELAIIA
jgi:hypothetical protein